MLIKIKHTFENLADVEKFFDIKKMLEQFENIKIKDFDLRFINLKLKKVYETIIYITKKSNNDPSETMLYKLIDKIYPGTYKKI